MAETIPEEQRTREPGLGDGAPRPRRRAPKSTRFKAFAWTGTVIGVAATVAVCTVLFAKSGPASPSLTVGTPPVAPGATLSDPGGTGVNDIAFSPDGNWLAVGHTNGSSFLWNPVTQTLAAPPLRHNPNDDAVRSIAVSSADMLAIGTDNSSFTAGDITLWNARTHGYLMTLSDPGGAGVPGGLAFDQDGAYLVADDGNGAIYLWNVYMDMPPTTLHDPGTGKVFGVAFQPGTHTFAVADGNGSVYLWDTTDGEQASPPLQDPDSGGVRGGVAFSADGTMLAAGDANGNVYIWSMKKDKIVETLPDPQGLQVNDVSFSPDGDAVAATVDNPAHTVSAIRVWILATRQVYTFRDPRTTGALHLAFSPDGSLLAVGDANGNTYLWDMSWLNSWVQQPAT